MRGSAYIVAAKDSDDFAIAVKLNEQPLFHILNVNARGLVVGVLWEAGY